jgi:MYXO-CTERM domain-containing protein
MIPQTRNASVLSACSFLLIGLLGTTAQAATYYVSTTGSDSSDGTSEATAWQTITYAASVATAGDIVYIKAGLYEGELVEVRNSGTADAPIVFQGYSSTPGDTPTPSYTPGDDLDSTVMPVLKGSSTESTEDIAFDMYYRSYVEVRNLGVQGYNYGVFPASSDNITIDHVYADNNGVGIMFRSVSSATVTDCVVTDSWTQNYFIWKTTDSTLENCESYAVQTSSVQTNDNGTDYHIILADCQDVIVRDSSVENLHPTVAGSHPGHGIGIKDYYDDDTGTYPNPHSTGNQIINCTALHVGEYFYAAHQSYGNVFENCTAIGDFSVEDGWSSAIIIRDGAHDNTFRGFYGEGTHSGVIIEDSEEGDVGEVASNNTIVNSVFLNTRKGIELSYADNNLFQNCVFDTTGWWIFVRFPYERVGTGNAMRNSIVGYTPGYLTYADAGSTETFSFTYTDFFSNGFDMPAGTGNLAVDPLFVDSANRDYHLMSTAGRWDATNAAWVTDSETSPCIDTGDPTDAYALESCPNGGRIDMGAYGNTEQASHSTSEEACKSDSDGDPETGTGGSSSGTGGSSASAADASGGSDDGGCGCSTSPARGGVGWFAAAALAIACASRRRRA